MCNYDPTLTLASSYPSFASVTLRFCAFFAVKTLRAPAGQLQLVAPLGAFSWPSLPLPVFVWLSPVESKCTACGRIKVYHPDGQDLVVQDWVFKF